MNHEHAFELVPLYALDALDGEELADVVSHVDTCAICASELARHLAVTSALVPDAPAPSHVWTSIEASLHGEPQLLTKTTGITAWRWVLGAAAALALVFGGFVLGQTTGSNLFGSEAIVAAADNASQEQGTFVADFLVEDVPVARVVVTSSGEGYLIPNEELTALGEDRTYQLWVITPEELVISAGVLGNQPGPATFTWTDGFAGFALSREVAGGVVSSEGDIISVISEA